MYDKIEDIELMLNMTSSQRNKMTKYYALTEEERGLFTRIYNDMNKAMMQGRYSYTIHGVISNKVYKLLDSCRYNIDIVRFDIESDKSNFISEMTIRW